MIVKFFNYGRNTQDPVKATKQAVGYLFSELDANKEKRSVAPIAVRGDAETFSSIVAYGNQSGRYTSGVLSFAENDIDSETQEKIISDFEATLLPGLEPEQYSSLWVRHQDKGRLELHFMFASEELNTGKRLNAYYHKADSTRINAWKDAINVEYALKDPNAPSNQQPTLHAKNLPKGKKEISEALTNHMIKMMGDGVIEDSREGIIEELKSLKLEVARETNKSISIKNPDGGQNIRLKGTLWERDFKAPKQSREAIEQRDQEYNEQSQERAREARDRVRQLCERRYTLNKKKYKKPEPVEDLRADNGSDNSADYRYRDRGTGRELLPKQDHRNDTSRQPEFNPVPEGFPTRKPDILPAIKKEIKVYADADRKRNPSIYEDLIEKLRRKRGSFKGFLGRAFRGFREKPRTTEDFDRKLHSSTGVLQRNFERLRKLNTESEEHRKESKRDIEKLILKKNLSKPSMEYHPN